MIPRAVSAYDSDILQEIRDTVGAAPGLMAAFFKRRTTRARDKFRKELRAPMPLPPLPFVWSLDPVKNARARGWYFANKVPKGSRGGRYERTNTLVKAIDIKAEFLRGYLEAQLSIYVSNPSVEYVFGNRQVPSHKAGGKPNLDEMAVRYGEALTLGIIEDWYTVTDPNAGIR
jgi:hypothetical protein